MIFAAKDNVIWKLTNGKSLYEVLTEWLCMSFNKNDVRYLMDNTFLNVMESLYYCKLTPGASAEAITNMGNIDGLIVLSLTNGDNDTFSLHVKYNGIKQRCTVIRNIKRYVHADKNINLQASSFTNEEWGIILKILDINSAKSIVGTINVTVLDG